MIDLLKTIISRHKTLMSIILLLFIVSSYIPMFCTYELYVQWWVLIIALFGGFILWLVFFLYLPHNSVFYLFWIIAEIIYFYPQVIYFEEETLQVSTVLVVLGFVVVLTPFIVSNFKKKKPVDIKRPEVYLGRTRAYNRIHFRIRRMMHDSEGKAIALYGRWGIGKSHCIQFLSHRLQNKFERTEYDDNVTRDPASPLNEAFDGSFEICNISLWNYKTMDEAWTAIINELYYTITGNRGIDVHEGLSRLLNLLPKGEFLSALIDYIRLPHGNQNDDWSGVISDEIGKERRVLLIFDDIERAPYEIIRNLLPLIERLKAIKGMVVLCAISDDELVKVYQEHGVDADSLHGYLSKIFDFSFYLPEPSYHAIRGMEAKLIEKKYKDFPLLRSFLSTFVLNYDTPRQMERIAERLSSIELQYLYDATLLDMDDYDAKYKQKEFCIFLVEIIRLLYKPILEEINNNEKHLLTIFKLSSAIESGKNEYNNSSSNNDTHEEEELKNTYPKTTNRISSDSLIRSIFEHLSNYESTDIKSAIIMGYARRSTLSPRECDNIVHLKENYKGKKFEEILSIYFGTNTDCVDSIEMAKHEMIDYCIEKAYDAAYTDFLNNIYTYDPPNDEIELPGSANFHNMNIERFFHLINTCKFQLVNNETNNHTHIAVENILDSCSIYDIYPHLRSIEKCEQISYTWYNIDKVINSNVLMSLHPPSNLINKIIKIFTHKMILFVFSDVYTESTSKAPGHHEIFHFFDNDIYNQYKEIVSEVIKENLSRIPITETNLYKIMVYFLSEGKYDPTHAIFAVSTSKWIVDTFRPWLNECLQKLHPSAKITDKIPKWLERINESRELWSPKQEGEKYVAGANELLSIMEKLQGKANPIE